MRLRPSFLAFASSSLIIASASAQAPPPAPSASSPPPAPSASSPPPLSPPSAPPPASALPAPTSLPPGAPPSTPPGWAPQAPPGPPPGWAPQPPPPGTAPPPFSPPASPPLAPQDQPTWGTPPLAPQDQPTWATPPAMGAPPPAPLQLKAKGAWYGWQILTAVGASDTLFIAGAATGGGAGSSALIGTGIVGHLLSGAAIHFAHRNWKMGGASIGLNVGGPLVLGLTGGLIGVLACAAGAGKDSEFGCLAAIGFGGAGGLVLGGMAATIVDSAAFAYEPLPPNKPPVARAQAPSFTLIPLLGPGRTGLGVAGQF